jgi:flagellar biosynthetic protein FlhB
MAEASDPSRTEPASPRRLQQARSAGNVPRSAELAAWAVLLSALGMLGWLAPRLIDALQALTAAAFIHAAQPLSPIFLEAAQAALWAVLPVLAVIFVAALVALPAPPRDDLAGSGGRSARSRRQPGNARTAARPPAAGGAGPAC